MADVKTIYGEKNSCSHLAEQVQCSLTFLLWFVLCCSAVCAWKVRNFTGGLQEV